MRIVICDCCGQRMDGWVTITPEIESLSQVMNVADIIRYTATRELCETCFKQFLTQIETRRKDR